MSLADSHWFHESRKRFVVESDLGVQRVGLECDWKFVRHCLALGVNSYGGGLLELKRKLSTSFKDVKVKFPSVLPIMNVRKRENDVLLI